MCVCVFDCEGSTDGFDYLKIISVSVIPGFVVVGLIIGLIIKLSNTGNV